MRADHAPAAPDKRATRRHHRLRRGGIRVPDPRQARAAFGRGVIDSEFGVARTSCVSDFRRVARTFVRIRFARNWNAVYAPVSSPTGFVSARIDRPIAPDVESGADGCHRAQL